MTRAREVAKYFTKASQQSTETLSLGDSDIVRVIIPGVGLDTNDANDNDILYWNASTGHLNFKQNTRQAVDVYTTMDSLPFDHEEGKMVYVDSDDRLYLWQGQGYYTITLTNADVSAIGGLNASYTLAKDGTSTVLTLTASDSDGTPIIWDYEVTAGSLATNTVTDSGNGRFTITPGTTDSAAGEFDITFSASDGINTSIATASFSLTFNTYYLLSIPPTQLNYSTNETRGTVAQRSAQPASVDASGNVYTSWYAGNYLNTQSSTYATTHIVTKHNIDGEFQTARAFYQDQNNYNGDYGISIGNHFDGSNLYEVTFSRYAETGQLRFAFFLKRMSTSNLAISKMNCINNGNSFWWTTSYVTCIFDSNDKCVLLGPNAGSQSNRPFSFTLDRVDTSSMNTLEKTQTNWTVWSGISAGSNIHQNRAKILHEMPDGNYLVIGDGYNLLNTTSYDREGGFIASVHDSSMDGSADGMGWDKKSAGGTTRYDTVNGFTAASIGNSTSWSTYVPFYHINSTSSHNYGGILKLNSTSTTSFVSSTNSSDYSPWIKILDNTFNVYPNGIATDGTYLYVIAYADSKRYIIKIDPDDGSVVKCIADSNDPNLGSIYYYNDKLWITASGSFNSTSTPMLFNVDTDLNVDLDGVTNTNFFFTVQSNVTTSAASDTRTRKTSFSVATNTGSSSFIENAYGSFPTGYGANANYYDATPVTTVPDRDATILT